MKKRCELFLTWIPRILTIVYILFVSMFALDVFGEGYGLWGTIIALFMHLIPTIVLVIILVSTWKKPRIAGITFIIIAILFTLFFRTYNDAIGFLIITGPLLLIGILYLAQCCWCNIENKKKTKKRIKKKKVKKK